MSERILVVEDEITLCHNIARFLTRQGHTVVAVETAEEALAELELRTFDFVVTDLRLHEADGLAVLDRVRAAGPECVVFIMTAYASVEAAVEALRRGANDFVLKPLSLSDLQSKIDRFVDQRRHGRTKAPAVGRTAAGRDALELLRGGPTMDRLCALVERVAAAPSNLLITGEEGTGKELVARAVHERSARAGGPFVTLAPSAVPEGTFERILFGDADARREGLIVAASGGTLFLDEIGDLAPVVQAQLLRVIEHGEVVPVGSDRPVRVDTRIVAATRRDPSDLVHGGALRQDLLYRLQVVHLKVPPLREREGAIPLLARRFLDAHARKQQRAVRGFSDRASAALAAYSWPGNVRELSNVVERAVVLATGDTVDAGDLPREVYAPGLPGEATTRDDENCNLEQVTLGFQRQHLARVLGKVNGNREAAAKLLGVSNATFYRYLQKAGLKGYAGDGGDTLPPSRR